MKNLGTRGFSLVETLVAAAVVSIAVIAVVAVIRKGSEQMVVNKHRGVARAIVDSTLEGPRFYPENYQTIPATIASDVVALTSNLNATRTFTITSATIAGEIPYKDIKVRLQWTEPSGGATDFVEMERMVPEIPKPNIAPLANNIISSSFYPTGVYPQCPPWNVVDGIIGLQFVGDWAANNEATPWIRLTWPQTYTITKIVLYDRHWLSCRAKLASITFSDLSAAINNVTIPDEGSATVMFAPKAVTWIQIQLNGTCSGFLGVGLSEVEVY
jgi:hypothetical protein